MEKVVETAKELKVVAEYDVVVCGGIAEELLKLSIEKGSEDIHLPECLNKNALAEERSHHRYEVQYNPNVFAIFAEKLLLKEGAELLYGTTVCNTLCENGKTNYIITENKSGRQAIKVKSVVAAAIGDDFTKTDYNKLSQILKNNGVILHEREL